MPHASVQIDRSYMLDGVHHCDRCGKDHVYRRLMRVQVSGGGSRMSEVSKWAHEEYIEQSKKGGAERNRGFENQRLNSLCPHCGEFTTLAMNNFFPQGVTEAFVRGFRKYLTQKEKRMRTTHTVLLIVTALLILPVTLMVLGMIAGLVDPELEESASPGAQFLLLSLWVAGLALVGITLKVRRGRYQGEGLEMRLGEVREMLQPLTEEQQGRLIKELFILSGLNMKFVTLFDHVRQRPGHYDEAGLNARKLRQSKCVGPDGLAGLKWHAMRVQRSETSPLLKAFASGNLFDPMPRRWRKILKSA